jgi:hypothetical protein
MATQRGIYEYCVGKYALLIFIQVILLLQIAGAQQITRASSDSIKNDYHYYMKKRSTYNTVGWVCLGTGVGLGIIGLGETVGGGINVGLSGSNNQMVSKGAVLFAIGNVVALASIPFFISAHHNKMKASLSLKKAGITINNHILYNSGYTALCIKIGI